MDWLRKLLGFHDRPREDGNPFRSPTWEEIMRKRDAGSTGTQNPKDFHHDRQDSWGPFFHGGFHNNDMFSPHQELFGHIDDMFSHLEDMMKDMHRHPAWAIPDSLGEAEPQTPRDNLLKVPDTDPDTVPPHPPFPPHNGYEGEQERGEDFNQHVNPFIFDPHGLFDRIFENFGMHPHEMPFSDHRPEIDPGTEFEDHSRESLIKKRDSDIDDRVLDDLSKLPKGGPGYSQTVDPRWSPWSHPESSASPHTGTSHKFYSQSIVTIRKPDGSIEETKKYTDSTGREEVTVTHKQPEEGTTNLTPLHPGGLPDQTPSIFSWFFTR